MAITEGREFPGWPRFEQEEIAAAAGVLNSGKVNYWTGDEGRQFEQEFAAFLNCRHAITLVNGSIALEVALYALGIGPGDDVVTTSRSFIATACSILRRGARPVFADVDRHSQNLTAETIRAALTPATKAILAVHLAGWPCDMDAIHEVARENNLKVIEDCAQACGACYKDRLVGSLSDAAAFSFCQDKIMSTGGEGGMLTTNSEEAWERAWSLRDHGKTHNASRHRSEAAFRWVHESVGTNLRMTEMQSAIGRVVLRKVPQWVGIRRKNAEILASQFGVVPGLRVALPPDDIRHAYYRFYVFVEQNCLRSGWNRDRILQAITDAGVSCSTGTCSELYLEKVFSSDLRPTLRLPIAMQLGETSIAFPVHPTMAEEHMFKIAHRVLRVMRSAVK